MAGTPSEAELRTMLQNVVAILEEVRTRADGTLADGGGLYDVLEQSLEGQYAARDIPAALRRHRATVSGLVSPATAQALLTPLMFEWGRILSADATDGFGGGYENLNELLVAIYEWFVDNSFSVETRSITFDTSATAGASNVGNGAFSRVTVDENGFDLENCHVERKAFRVRRDRNTGTLATSEVFEFVGENRSSDDLLIGNFGSGEFGRSRIINTNTGGQRGGSVLNNGSFSQYSASATPKFTNWTEDSGSANVAQDTTAHYIAAPGNTDTHSLRLNGSAKISQRIATQARQRSLDPNRPYFCRLMWNRATGSGSGGTLSLRLGSQTASVAISAQTGWNELIIPLDPNCWFKNFNEDGLDVEIEWASASSGYLLIDDVILSPMTEIDGTYWVVRHNNTSPVNWMVDDQIRFTDTGGAAGTGSIQWWLWRAFNIYLPSSGIPTITDP